ncbi:ankyrin repeat domain-containing protein [Fulvivirgaceae bacterium BMA10]|uniref:Ankyrin repeat domain-containing protein n=1 Tax=Splendidivirga corallicola TaxID=3051826 RepID=A0ABT8KNY6_9BACT|nr:ankyrin repeat domain-containing protein [Fulvivirgaceae bacterium BMA10]
MFRYDDIVELLINTKANINNYEGAGMTALMFAAQNNHPDIVKKLYSTGANPHMKDKNRETVPDKAIKNDHESITRWPEDL